MERMGRFYKIQLTGGVMIYKKLYIPIFGYTIYFVQVNAKTTALEFVNKFKIYLEHIPEIDKERACCIRSADRPESCLIFNKKNTLPIIVHEISHVVDHIFTYYGFSHDDGELKAYLFEFIFENFQKKFKVKKDN